MPTADNVIPFPRVHRLFARRPGLALTSPPPSDLIPADDVDAVTDLLLLLESAPLAEPVARGLIDVTGRPVVGVVVGKVQRCLRPEQARVAACAMVAENALAGAVGFANALARAADQAQALYIARRAGQLLGARGPAAVSDGIA